MKNISTSNFQRLMITSVIAMALHHTTAFGQTVNVPPVPTNLEAPAGHVPYLKGYATGTQNYVCLPTGWTFLGPQATLFVTVRWLNTELRYQVATHFLSSNPAEDGTPRPTWQGSSDTSSVWGKAIANSTDPNYVAQGAIPWLLLEVVGAQRGPTGGSILSQTTYIQRVNTSGGVIPTSPCMVGSTALVPYTTDYFFYRAAGN